MSPCCRKAGSSLNISRVPPSLGTQPFSGLEPGPTGSIASVSDWNCTNPRRRQGDCGSKLGPRSESQLVKGEPVDPEEEEEKFSLILLQLYLAPGRPGSILLRLAFKPIISIWFYTSSFICQASPRPFDHSSPPSFLSVPTHSIPALKLFFLSFVFQNSISQRI